MKLFLLLLSFFVMSDVNAQTWQLLPNSPSSTSFRHDDLFFINKDTGWVCNVDGKIYRTLDGGNSWATQLYQSNTSFRCIGFSDFLHGWAGNLGIGQWSPTIDTLPFYFTNDGGITWAAVSNISGILPKGICGINVVNDSVIYAVGRVGGPAYLLKTTDAGLTWQSIDMNTWAFQLIDCKFFSVDTGFVVGSFPGPNYTNCKYRILYTTDAGANWQIVTSGTDSFQNCWKINFVNRMLGYVSVESDLSNDTLPVLKTIDGGLTWQRKIVSTNGNSYEQGIGFINDSVGWIGSFGYDLRITNNGGDTWTSQNTIIPNFNRMRKVNDSLAYAVGNNVWKYTSTGVGISQSEKLENFEIIAVSPNPFSTSTILSYRIPSWGSVEIRLYDFAGRPVSVLHKANEMEGEHSLEIKIPYYYDTHFFVVIRFKGYKLATKIFNVK